VAPRANGRADILVCGRARATPRQQE